MCVCSMDGLRVVRIDEVLKDVDIVVTATGKLIDIVVTCTGHLADVSGC
jgi:S-adenosylhomocysteine hydrolase